MFKTKPQPPARRVNCTVTSVLERTVLAATLDTPKKNPTPAVVALCQRLATSIGEDQITSDVVGKVITALRNAIIQDLRATGKSCLEGFVRFIRVDVKARPAQYVQNSYFGGVILRKAKGQHQRVYGQVPCRSGNLRQNKRDHT